MSSQATSMFTDGQQYISGGNFTSTGTGNIQFITHNQGPDKAFSKLTDRVVPGALHTSGECSDPPKCHPGTRVDVLTVLITWALLTIYDYPIQWLNGPAGAGKSAIMRSFAEMLVEKGLLLASFFFYRCDARRNTVEHLISTIAYELCINVPPLRPWVERAIDLNPLIFDTSLSHQIQALIIDPFLHYFYDPNSIIITPFPRIIIIDGLDECTGDKIQQEIVQKLCKLVQTLPIPVAIVFASRPEHQIRSTFELGSLSRVSSRITLDDSFKPDEDIKCFYLHEFVKIQSTHPMRAYLGAAWPSQSVIQILVLNASGQFIYASTVVKFVQSSRHNPALRLQIILGEADQGRSQPFQQLDILYRTIFLNIIPEDLQDALRVLGIIFTPLRSSSGGRWGYQSPKFVELLLGFPAGHVRFLLLDLESILTVKGDEEDIHIYHASLADFLFDKSRADDFFIDRGLVYADIALSSINLICCPQRATVNAFSQDFGYYFEKQISVSLQNASPTNSLHHAIISSDMGKIVSFQCSSKGSEPGLDAGTLALLFIFGVKGSSFPDAESLCQEKLPPLVGTINQQLIKHWLELESRFRPALLFTLLVGLTPASSVLLADASSLFESVSMAGNTLSILPCIRYRISNQDRSHSSEIKPGIWDVKGAFCKWEDFHLLGGLILDIINAPTGFLHDGQGQQACSNLTLHLVQELFKKLSQSTPYPGQMDTILPFLFSVSLVQKDLMMAVQEACTILHISSHPTSGMVTAAMNTYLQRAKKEIKSQSSRRSIRVLSQNRSAKNLLLGRRM